MLLYYRQIIKLRPTATRAAFLISSISSSVSTSTLQQRPSSSRLSGRSTHITYSRFKSTRQAVNSNDPPIASRFEDQPSSQPHTRVRVLVLPRHKPPRLPQGIWNLALGLRIRLIGEGRVFKAEEDKRAWRAMPKAGYYAVAAGRQPGVYTTWGEAEAQVKAFSGAKYKKFGSMPEAEAFLSTTTTRTTTTKSRPYDRPKDTGTTPKEAQQRVNRREASPITQALPSTLPSHLADLAQKGYAFTTRPPHHLIVYTDGSSLSNGKSSARAGLGVWWGDRGEAAERGLSERVPGGLQTNNRGELLSVIRALETCPFPELPIEIRTDSQYTIACMTTYLTKWLQNNFLTSGSGSASYGKFSKKNTGSSSGTTSARTKVKNADLIKHLLVLLRRRGPGNGVRFKYVPGHQGVEGNEGADRLARRGAAMKSVPERLDWLDPDDENGEAVQTGQDGSMSSSQAEIDVEIDENWLLTEEEMAALEQDFKEE